MKNAFLASVISPTLCLFAMAAVPQIVAAQSFELGAFAGVQSYRQSSDLKPNNNTVTGLRLGYSLLDVGPALLQVTAGYQPESSTKVKFDGGDATLKQSYAALGAMFNFKMAFALGAGLEYRAEKLSVDSGSTTYNRPWARVNVGYALPTPLLKPFIGLEYSRPLSSHSGVGDDDASVLKGIASKSQIGLYGGIRF